MGKKGNSSGRWLDRQRRDPYVRKAHDEGTVSRAHYKLEQLDRKYRLVAPNQLVLELGAAPGGWTQYLSSRIANGLIIAVDPLPVAGGAGVEVIAGEYGNDQVDVRIGELLGGRKLNLVLSDMAPNLSGIRAADQAAAIHLADLCLDAAERWLKPAGSLVVKVFHGEGLEGWLAQTKRQFRLVRLVKPEASRKESREAYVVATGWSGRNRTDAEVVSV
jgi:23S rRNA (uridine2552-2'-O)-methyltransferase